MYQRLVPTKLHYLDQPEGLAHILAGCPALTQNDYTVRHNAGHKSLYFSLLKHYDLMIRIPPRLTAIVREPKVENDQVKILCDVRACSQAEYRKRVTGLTSLHSTNQHIHDTLVLGFRRPWVMNGMKEDAEKIDKLQVRKELKVCHPGFSVRRINVIIDVLGGECKTRDLEKN